MDLFAQESKLGHFAMIVANNPVVRTDVSGYYTKLVCRHGRQCLIICSRYAMDTGSKATRSAYRVMISVVIQ